MNKNVKNQWVTALRSGDYRQGFGALVDGRADTYCCLGVLCDLAVQAGVISWDEYREWGDLPFKVVKWAGLEDSDPLLRDYSLTGKEGDFTASDLNDGLRKDFNHIASLIEEQL